MGIFKPDMYQNLSNRLFNIIRKITIYIYERT